MQLIVPSYSQWTFLPCGACHWKCTVYYWHYYYRTAATTPIKWMTELLFAAQKKCGRFSSCGARARDPVEMRESHAGPRMGSAHHMCGFPLLHFFTWFSRKHASEYCWTDCRDLSVKLMLKGESEFINLSSAITVASNPFLAVKCWFSSQIYVF